MNDCISEVKTTVVSGNELRTCRLRRILPGGQWSDWETHTDLRGSPVGEKVLVWEYEGLVRSRGARSSVGEHVKVMYCADGWHSTGGKADAPDDPQVCSTLMSSKWRRHRVGEERFRRFWEFHQEHPVVWIVQISAEGDAGNRRLAYCDLELPAEYRPTEATGERGGWRGQGPRSGQGWPAAVRQSAAAVHDQAAELHRHAAQFFDDHGEPGRADRERNMADRETRNAEAEREHRQR
jgi:hypothetical protein